MNVIVGKVLVGVVAGVGLLCLRLEGEDGLNCEHLTGHWAESARDEDG